MLQATEVIGGGGGSLPYTTYSADHNHPSMRSPPVLLVPSTFAQLWGEDPSFYTWMGHWRPSNPNFYCYR